MRAIFISISVLIASLLIAGCGVSKKIETIQNTQVPQVTAGDEMAARLRLTAIGHAEVEYQAATGGGYASMDELIQNHYLTDPNNGQLSRYRFDVEVSEHGFAATAVPEKYPLTGRRSFYIDESNVLRGADKGGEKATASDPAL